MAQEQYIDKEHYAEFDPTKLIQDLVNHHTAAAAAADADTDAGTDADAAKASEAETGSASGESTSGAATSEKN